MATIIHNGVKLVYDDQGVQHLAAQGRAGPGRERHRLHAGGNPRTVVGGLAIRF